MPDLLTMIAQTAPGDTHPAPPTSEVFWDSDTIVIVVICTVGLCVLAAWMFWYDGFYALRKAPVRRHRKQLFVWPVLILALWLVGISLVHNIMLLINGFLSESVPEFITYFLNAAIEMILIILILIIAHKAFARGLKGFGLKSRTIPKDVGLSIIHLLAVYPLIALALFAVTSLGQSQNGEFEIQQHQTLKFLTQNSNIAINIMMTFIVVGLVPAFEEMLFRGFIQSTLRSATNPWTAIIITSTFFTINHYPNVTHMPSLFFLSCGLGYAYERSGSLFRPILMHLLFNGISVISTLLMTS